MQDKEELFYTVEQDIRSSIVSEDFVLNRETSLFNNSFIQQHNSNNQQPGAHHKQYNQNNDLNNRCHSQGKLIHQIDEQLPAQLVQVCHDVVKQLFLKVQLQCLRTDLQTRMTPIYTEFCQNFDNLLNNISIEQSITNYIKVLVKYWHQEMFFQHFVENKYLSILINKIRTFKYADHIVKPIFRGLQYLLKGLGGDEKGKGIDNREEQFIYLLVMINKEGFVTENYQFSEVEDWAYYAHFMKLLIRIVNQADRAQQAKIRQNKEKIQSEIFTPSNLPPTPRLRSSHSLQQSHVYSKYLSIFFNQRQPQFPLILNLLKLLYFSKLSDTILLTSAKLCILQISNHPSLSLQKYLLNFPYVTFYLLYCNRVAERLQKLFVFSATRKPSANLTENQEISIEQICNDIRFLEDYLKFQEQTANFKAANSQQHLNMYINSFFYYIGRCIYQQLSKYFGDENTNGIINCFILIIKILKLNSILKIKLGFQEMFHKYINCQLLQYLKGKRQKLECEKYWMFDVCAATVREHSETVLFSNEDDDKKDKGDLVLREPVTEGDMQEKERNLKPQIMSPTKNQSALKKLGKSAYSTIFNTMKSYIPNTNSSWLFYQMKKISEVIGLEVSLNKQIQHYSSLLPDSPSMSLYKNSFLFIIDIIQENHLHGSNSLVLRRKKSLFSRTNSPIKPNLIFGGLMNICKYKQDGHKNKKHHEDNSEQLLYYYLVMMCSFNDHQQFPQSNPHDILNLEEISELIKITKKCRSLMLVGMMYWYVKLVDYQLDSAIISFTAQSQVKQDQENQEIGSELLQIYMVTMEKLVYFILTEGWQSFLKHIKTAKTMIWGKKSQKQPFSYEDVATNPQTQFTNDIFRDIQCDIVFFVMLRHIFGTKNSSDQLSEQICDSILSKDNICKQLKLKCKLTNAQGDQAFMIMDGQYLKFTTQDDFLITKKPLSINCFNVYQQEYIPDEISFAEQTFQNTKKNSYEQENYGADKKDENDKIKTQMTQSFSNQKKKSAVFQLVDKSINGESFTVFFSELLIRQYVANEIKKRKSAIMNIEICLRTMLFGIED